MDQRTILPGRRRRAALVTAAGALALLVGLGIGVAGRSSATGFDAAIKSWLDSWLSLGTADAFADLGSPQVIVPLAVVAAAVFAARRWFRSALLVLLGPGVSVALVDLVAKPVVGRTLGGIGLSYPSGHTAAVSAFAVAVIVTVFGPGRWALGPLRAAVLTGGSVVLVLACAAGLVVAGDHYSTDTIGGTALSTATVLLLALAFDAAANRRSGYWSDRRSQSSSRRVRSAVTSRSRASSADTRS